MRRIIGGWPIVEKFAEIIGCFFKMEKTANMINTTAKINPATPAATASQEIGVYGTSSTA